MNRELVERLYREADEHCLALGPNTDGTNRAWVWEQKFAELVAVEAAKVCERVYPSDVPLYLVGLGFSEAIKTHFQIEK